MIDDALFGTKLPRMQSRRCSDCATLQVRLRALLLSLALVSACERSRPVARADSSVVTATTRVDSSTHHGNSSGWDSGAGPALLVQGATGDEAILLLPADDDRATAAYLDSTGGRTSTATLFGRGGARFSARLGPAPTDDDPQCRLWPLREIRTDGAATSWAIGFLGAQVAPLALDSVDVLTSRDSTALVAEVSRLASTVTATTSASFQGLRFTAHDIRRFEATPGVQAIVAHLIRKVNQEANPQEEQTLLIAERDSGVTSGPYQLAYAERTQGLEEEVTSPEVIAGVRLGALQRPVLIVARDGDDGVSYAMLERVEMHRWRVRWISRATRCG